MKLFPPKCINLPSPVNWMISEFQNRCAQYVGTGPKGTTPPSQLWANVVQWAASRHACLTLDGRGWGRMDTCICMAESLRCLPETITLFVNQLYQYKIKILLVFFKTAGLVEKDKLPKLRKGAVWLGVNHLTGWSGA